MPSSCSTDALFCSVCVQTEEVQLKLVNIENNTWAYEFGFSLLVHLNISRVSAAHSLAAVVELKTRGDILYVSFVYYINTIGLFPDKNIDCINE